MNLLFYSLVCGVFPDTDLRIFPHKPHRRTYCFNWHYCCTEWSAQIKLPLQLRCFLRYPCKLCL